MLFCTNCGTPTGGEGRKFCTKCGAVYFVKDGHPICRPKKG